MKGWILINFIESEKASQNMQKEQRDIHLKVGEAVALKKGFMSKEALVFGGKPDRDTFTLVVSFTMGNNSWAYNLFYPSSRRSLELRGRLLEILSVTPDELRLNVLEIPEYAGHP